MFEHSFVDSCLFGDTDLEDIDNYVDYWHSHETESTLRDFIGMSQYEYEEWLKYGDSILRDILRCRADGTPYEDYQYMSTDERIAARSYSIDKIEKLKNDDKHGNK